MVKVKEGQSVWVKDASIAGLNLYTKGHVLNINGNKVTVETSNSVKTQELVLPIGECFQINPDVDAPDHCQLMHLNQATLLVNTIKRFKQDKVYTYVGNILVAVNPFKNISGLYGPEVMQQCRGKRIGQSKSGPHPYCIAEKAYAAMKKAGGVQCVVVSGESGAGKTETNKLLMHYLVWRGSDEKSARDLATKILETNPILESFGNAKTLRNNNSSRFGRYVLVQFSDINEVVGAQVRTFLLERSRVTSASSPNERSYHVLYQVALCSKHCDLPMDKFRYLSMSGCTTADGIDDRKWFQAVGDALRTIGMSTDELDQLWGFLSALLYLGNIDFGGGSTAEISDGSALHKAEGLLGVSGMQRRLLARTIFTRGETTYIEHTPQQAALARDSLVKVMYDRLFASLVCVANATVNAPKAARYVGLLDVYGFEYFEQNSFEQLCINFANEKLHKYFLRVVFDDEAAAHRSEGVPWTPITYADNAPLITLLEAPSQGVYGTLDSQCRTPNASGRTFCAQLHRDHAESKFLLAPKISRTEKRSKEDHFVIRHFAGDVVYFAGEFLEKNNDSLPAGFDELLMTSSKPLVVRACAPPIDDAGVNTSNGRSPSRKSVTSFGSVGAKFLKSLRTLMEELDAASAHFIRCIKPNKDLAPGRLEGDSVLTQLRLSGTLDAVRMLQGGYPTRIAYADLYGRYKEMMPPQVASLPPPQFCEVIAEVCGVGKSDFFLGAEKMFFRVGAAAVLEDLSEAEPEAMKTILLEKLRLFESMAAAKPLIEANLLMWLHKRRYAPLLAERRRKAAEEKRRREEKQRKEEEKKRKEEEAKRRTEEVEAKRRAAELALEKERKAAESKDANKGEAQAHERKKAEAEAEAAKVFGQVEALAASIDSDAELEAEVLRLGGVRRLVELGARHIDSPRLQERFTSVLRDVCVSDEMAQRIADEGGIDAIVEAAQRHYDSPEVQKAVAGALRNLSELDQLALAISELGGIVLLVDAAGRHPNDAAVQARVAGALWGLSVHDEVSELIIDAGGADRLVAAARTHLRDPEVQAAVAGALRNLSVSNDHKQYIVDINGVETLVAASEVHLDSALVQAQVAGALRNLSLKEEVAERITLCRGVPALLTAAETHVQNARVQAGVAGALRNLSINDETVGIIVDSGGIEALLTASKEHSTISDVQAEVAGALWGLCVNDEVEEAISAAGGVAVLVAAAQTHIDCAKVQARVSGALRKLSARDDNKRAIADSGGVQMLIRSSRTHASNVVVQAGVAGALSNLSVDDDIEQLIAREGGIETLLAACKRHTDNVRVQSRVMRALTNLSVNDANKRRIALDDGISAIVTAATALVESAEMQTGVAGALRNLAVNPDIGTAIVYNKAVGLLLRVATAHPTNATVITGVAGVLRNLAANPIHQEILLEEGAWDILMSAADAHAGNPKLRVEVLGALRNLSAARNSKSGQSSPSGAAQTNGLGESSDRRQSPSGPIRRSLSFGRLKSSSSPKPPASPCQQRPSLPLSLQGVSSPARTPTSKSPMLSFRGLGGGLSRRSSPKPPRPP